MVNARQELDRKLDQYGVSVLFGEVSYVPEPGVSDDFVVRDDNHADFFKWINGINYDQGYGRQFLLGRIWVEKQSGEIATLTRCAHDGAEWWGLGDFTTVPQRLFRLIGPTWKGITLGDGREFLVRSREQGRAIYPNGCYSIGDLLSYRNEIEHILSGNHGLK
jgi:hypothetical protein